MTDVDRAPIVVFGDDWGRNVSTMQHIFRWIIPEHPVFWVNGIGHRKPTLSGRDIRRAVEKVRGALRPRGPAADWSPVRPTAVVAPRVFPWHDVRLLYAYNTRWLTRTIRRTLAVHGITDPPVLVTGSPPSVGVVGRLGERAAIYYCMDDFPALPSVSQDMLASLEARLLDVVDAVVATARTLTVLKRPRSGRIHYLPQGVNFEHFATPRVPPADVASLPRPRIGFAGGLYDRLDFDILRALAEANRSGSVVLVGSVGTDVHPLQGLPNVHLLGARSYEELPAYVQSFDVGIIPYRLNAETRSVDPLKLLEYLAAGIPVVATALPEVEKYRDAIGIAPDVETFVRSTQQVVRVRSDELRRRGQELARRHDWSRRAAAFLDIVRETVAYRASRNGR